MALSYSDGVLLGIVMRTRWGAGRTVTGERPAVLTAMSAVVTGAQQAARRLRVLSGAGGQTLGCLCTVF